eukprot:CAMPEP_0171438200 /NCGR_PEP_ID=MMETSP0881-20121228/17721_1 /TAXON_ID=67004 /ORGANISM="Thalassiosira weissflogii, Strain CCMP1336" /LENGTH=43 /DNA_ID= /DNA_START= /DNA_END= /DNA_ORIENTATION=
MKIEQENGSKLRKWLNSTKLGLIGSYNNEIYHASLLIAEHFSG